MSLGFFVTTYKEMTTFNVKSNCEDEGKLWFAIKAVTLMHLPTLQSDISAYSLLNRPASLVSSYK